MQTMWLPENASMVVAQPRGDDIIITVLGPERPHWTVLKQFAPTKFPEGSWWVEIERLGVGGLRVAVMEENPGRPEGRSQRSMLYLDRQGRLPLGPTRVRARDLAVLLAAIPEGY